MRGCPIEAKLAFRILLGGLVMNRTLETLFLRSVEAIILATAVYSHVLCRLAQARQGFPRSHLVFRSTHSKHDSVGLLRFCLGFGGFSMPLLVVVVPLGSVLSRSCFAELPESSFSLKIGAGMMSGKPSAIGRGVSTARATVSISI